MTQKITINPTSTDGSPSAQSTLRLAGVGWVELGETQETFDIADRLNSIDLQFKTKHHLINLSTPIREQWIGFPTKTVSDVIRENENQDWKRQRTALLPAEVQSWIYVEKELAEIREEVKETCAVAKDVHPVPEAAYDETRSLLAQVSRNVPMPDIMWLEDGGIGLEWRPGDGIVTMSLYGEDHVTFVAILGNQHKIAGTCPLSDSSLLAGFLAILPLLFQQRT
ncbi:hypothetical protein F4Y93_01105 [Candidatus Poribacteria bacterium]|nr:hypothetical protein [Candidatus Poribacteria bacterium]